MRFGKIHLIRASPSKSKIALEAHAWPWKLHIENSFHRKYWNTMPQICTVYSVISARYAGKLLFRVSLASLSERYGRRASRSALIGYVNGLHPERSFFDLKNISLNQTNLCIAIRPKKSFFNLKKFLDCFFHLI